MKECREAYRRVRLSVTAPKFNNSNWPNRETTTGLIAEGSLKSPSRVLENTDTPRNLSGPPLLDRFFFFVILPSLRVFFHFAGWVSWPFIPVSPAGRLEDPAGLPLFDVSFVRCTVATFNGVWTPNTRAGIATATGNRAFISAECRLLTDGQQTTFVSGAGFLFHHHHISGFEVIPTLMRWCTVITTVWLPPCRWNYTCSAVAGIGSCTLGDRVI